MNPLTGIYGAASGLRNRLFDRGMLAVRRLERPVVSVGNLSVGGAGKTPFVITLGELLKARGVRCDVLSRGYGRTTRGVRIVEPGGSAANFGDEPLLIARRLEVPVIIGESRYEAGRLGEQMFDSQIHLLDDGFQHRSLTRDFDVVLVSESDLSDRLLPSGRLREPLAALSRADAIVLPCEAAMEDPAFRGKPVWRTKRKINVPDAPAMPVIFCGIARPEQLFAQVRAAGIQPAAEIAFRDHHAYRERDIEQLIAAQAKRGAGGFITTEKDAINLGTLQSKLLPLAITMLTVIIENSAGVVDTILDRIKL